MKPTLSTGTHPIDKNRRKAVEEKKKKRLQSKPDTNRRGHSNKTFVPFDFFFSSLWKVVVGFICASRHSLQALQLCLGRPTTTSHPQVLSSAAYSNKRRKESEARREESARV